MNVCLSPWVTALYSYQPGTNIFRELVSDTNIYPSLIFTSPLIFTPHSQLPCHPLLSCPLSFVGESSGPPSQSRTLPLTALPRNNNQQPPQPQPPFYGRRRRKRKWWCEYFVLWTRARARVNGSQSLVCLSGWLLPPFHLLSLSLLTAFSSLTLFSHSIVSPLNSPPSLPPSSPPSLPFTLCPLPPPLTPTSHRWYVRYHAVV